MQLGIYSLIQRSTMLELLSTFHACTELPIRLVDPAGEIIETYGEQIAYCNRMRRHVFSPAICQNEYQRATTQAKALGEAYIYTCHGNLNHIAYTFEKNDILYGAVIAGPFLMDKPDSTLLSSLPLKTPLAPAMYLDLYDDMTALKVVTPERVTPLGRLITYLFSPLIPTQKHTHALNRETLYQQSRINETIQMLKQEEETKEAGRLYSQEKELIQMVSKGDISAAKATLNELLGYVFFYEGGKHEAIKNRALELCALLSRVAIEKGGVTGQVLRLNDQFIPALNQAITQESICLLMQDIVTAFVDTVFSPNLRHAKQTIKVTLRYVAQNYTKPISVKDVSTHVGLSPNYFSTLFRQAMGMPFPEYVNRLRVEESKHLLSGTDFAIVDIAMSMGFSDQSYYSKVFKKITGVSPQQYR